MRGKHSAESRARMSDAQKRRCAEGRGSEKHPIDYVMLAEAANATCIEWHGYKDRAGYGVKRVNYRLIYVSRIALEWKLGRPIKPGYCALHNCPDGDNPACYNPLHLWEGTKADNSADMVRKGRSTGNRHWARRHPELVPRGDRHGARLHPECVLRGDRSGARLRAKKLNKEKAATIRQLAADGVPQKDIAAMFSVSSCYVNNIIHGRNWAEAS